MIISLVLWGGYYIACKQALETFPPITLCILKFAVAIGCYQLLERHVNRPKEKIQKKDRKYILSISVSGYLLENVFLIYGLYQSTPSMAAVISSLNTACLMTLSILILREKVTAIKLATVGITTVGILFVVGNPGIDNSLLGIVLDALSVVCWSLSCVILKRISQEYSTLFLTKHFMFIGCLLLLPFCIPELIQISHAPVHITGAAILSLLYAGVLGTALAYWCWNKALDILPASICSLFMPIQPLITTLFGVCFLEERFTVQFMIGSLLILGGIIIASLPARKSFIR